MPRTLARCTFFYEISIANYLLNKSHYFWGSDPLIIVYDDLSLITRFLSVGKGVSNMHHKQGGRNRWSQWSQGFTGNQSFYYREILRSWIYEGGNFLCFTGKKLVPTPLQKVECKPLFSEEWPRYCFLIFFKVKYYVSDNLIISYTYPVVKLEVSCNRLNIQLAAWAMEAIEEAVITEPCDTVSWSSVLMLSTIWGLGCSEAALKQVTAAASIMGLFMEK